MAAPDPDRADLPPGFAVLPNGHAAWQAALAAPETAIPPGGFCYRVLPRTADEVLEVPGSWFGDRERETGFVGPDLKRRLCPFWTETPHGTVRCEWLGMEQVTQRISQEAALALIAGQFRPGPSCRNVQNGNWLPDEIKICGVNEDDEGDGASDSGP